MSLILFNFVKQFLILLKLIFNARERKYKDGGV